MAIKKSTGIPYVAHGVETITGSKKFYSPYGNGKPVKAVQVSLAGATAAAVNNGLTVSAAINADGSVTVYVWKANALADTTLVAATVACDVNILMFC